MQSEHESLRFSDWSCLIWATGLPFPWIHPPLTWTLTSWECPRHLLLLVCPLPRYLFEWSLALSRARCSSIAWISPATRFSVSMPGLRNLCTSDFTHSRRDRLISARYFQSLTRVFTASRMFIRGLLIGFVGKLLSDEIWPHKLFLCHCYW